VAEVYKIHLEIDTIFVGIPHAHLRWAPRRMKIPYGLTPPKVFRPWRAWPLRSLDESRTNGSGHHRTNPFPVLEGVVETRHAVSLHSNSSSILGRAGGLHLLFVPVTRDSSMMTESDYFRRNL